MSTQRPFLTAEWRRLVMLNYQVDPSALATRLPGGCELDDRDGRHYVSVVGFRFLKTRVLGVPIPWHRDFDEVNLRFYVRHKAADGWRRGVVFVREIVPRRAIALVANRVYGENYVALPMRSENEPAGSGLARQAYSWKRGGAWESVAVTHQDQWQAPHPESDEAFITEHYWGYAKPPWGGTVEYEVRHPPWNVAPVEEATLKCDPATLYGPEFREALSGNPATAFIADGSPIEVHRGRRIV